MSTNSGIKRYSTIGLSEASTKGSRTTCVWLPDCWTLCQAIPMRCVWLLASVPSYSDKVSMMLASVPSYSDKVWPLCQAIPIRCVWLLASVPSYSDKVTPICSSFFLLSNLFILVFSFNIGVFGVTMYTFKQGHLLSPKLLVWKRQFSMLA